MSANSINHITTSSGKNTTLLDIEIDSEIKRLISNCKNKKGIDLKLKLTTALNNFFDRFLVLKPIYCLLFRILAVTMVSIVKNRAKITKKLSFSILTFGLPECSMGDKTA